MGQSKMRGILFVLFVAMLTPHSSTRCWAQVRKTLSERVAAIQQQHAELEKWFHEALVADHLDRKKVAEANIRYQKERRKLADALQPIIKAHPTDPAAFEAVLVQVEDLNSFLDEPATQIVLDHHVGNPAMGRLCFDIRHRGREEWPKKILEAVAKKHPQPDVRGQATFSLGDIYRMAARPFRDPPPKDESDRLLAKAEAYYRQTIAEFDDVTTPDGKWKLGERARHELARLENLENLQVGRPAPPIEGADLKGKPLKLEDFHGKVVVVVFWGSWCRPCMAEVPHERELYARLQGKPFALLGVSCGDTLELAKETAATHEMGWPSWWDGDETRSGPIQTDYDIQHWPSVFVIDTEGVIRAIDVHGPDLDAAVDEALAKVGPKGDGR